MSRFVRASKVRHVYANNPKKEHCYTGFRLSTASGDHQYIKANSKYMAFGVSQGGSLAVFEMDRDNMRLGPGVVPVIDGHDGPVLDFDWNPFHTNLITTGGDDCVAKVWGIPPEGLKESISDSLCDLNGHMKKVTVVTHHPTVNFVCATGSQDKTVKLWDLEQGDEKCTITTDGPVYGVSWSTHGELLGVTSKDKQLRLIDARVGEVVAQHEAHEGTKTQKITFCNGFPGAGGEAICTTGFTKQSKRQFKLFDMRKLGSGEYASHNIDQGAGVIIPFFDEGTNMLYLCGKGDANIRMVELVNEDPWQFSIGEYKGKDPCRGVCMVPKRVMDTSICEVARVLKLCKDKIEVLRFICPRKAKIFQADLYPDAYAGEAVKDNAGAYFDSDTSKPFKAEVKRITMDPKKRSGAKPKPGLSAATAGGKKEDVASLKKEVARLKDLLDKNNIKY
mmetsp:Transcript_7983/g.16025  ORF Transcript_7983/g.16025 Transcript_7983/m.16025 type:complete len:448 (-) Transcript_7983:122-1465(-)